MVLPEQKDWVQMMQVCLYLSLGYWVPLGLPEVDERDDEPRH